LQNKYGFAWPAVFQIKPRFLFQKNDALVITKGTVHAKRVAQHDSPFGVNSSLRGDKGAAFSTKKGVGFRQPFCHEQFPAGRQGRGFFKKKSMGFLGLP